MAEEIQSYTCFIGWESKSMLDDDIFHNIVEFWWSSVGSRKGMRKINKIVKRNVSDEFFL